MGQAAQIGPVKIPAVVGSGRRPSTLLHVQVIRSSIARHSAPTALAALAALVIHQVAYLLAFPIGEVRADQLTDHGHLATQWTIITPTAILAASWVVLRQVRQLGLAPNLRWTSLAALSTVMFVGQEAVEAVVQTGELATLISNPAALIGVALAPLVALSIAWVLREATEFIARLIERPTVVGFPHRSFPRPEADLRAADRSILGSSPRGPPLALRY